MGILHEGTTFHAKVFARKNFSVKNFYVGWQSPFRTHLRHYKSFSAKSFASRNFWLKVCSRAEYTLRTF